MPACFTNSERLCKASNIAHDVLLKDLNLAQPFSQFQDSNMIFVFALKTNGFYFEFILNAKSLALRKRWFRQIQILRTATHTR